MRLRRLFLALPALGLPLLAPTGASAQRVATGDPALLRALDGTVAATSPMRRTSADPLFGVVVHTSDVGALRRAGVTVEAVFDGFVTARLRASDVARVAKLPGVSRLAMGDDEQLHNDVAGQLVGAKSLHEGLLGGTSYRGAGAIVCIFDSGIDYKHLDFRSITDPTKSRVLRLYDMTLTATGAETTPQGLASTYTTGVEYTNAQLNDEIDGTPAGFVRSTDTNGHGTHVAGTAASNGGASTPRAYVGMAPDADIVFVKGGNGTFSSVNILNGIKYCDEVATAAGKPMVMNMSLGSDSGPHDGQDSKSAAVDQIAVKAGRAIVQSAGNSGGSLIHRTSTLAPGASVAYTFTVPAGTAGDPGFGVDMWSQGRDLSFSLTSPDGTVTTQAAGGSATTNTAQGQVFLYNYLITGTDQRDGDLDREMYFTVGANGTTYAAAGTWTVTVTNNDAVSDTFHAWMFDQTSGGTSSFVTFVGADALSTVSNAALNGIAAGSYMHRNQWPAGGSSFSYTGANRQDMRSGFSSQGPARDGRVLPHITAPGQAILSTRSTAATYAASDALPDGLHAKNQGTSMSAPVVAGSVALLLAANPSLTGVQVRSLLMDNAIVDAPVVAAGVAPNNEFGAGKLNVYQAMARMVNAASTSTLATVQYDAPGATTSGFTLAVDANALVRYTAPYNGRVRALVFHTSGAQPSGGYDVRVWADNAGVPGAQIGTTANLPFSVILASSWNAISLSSLNADLVGGMDYWVSLTPRGSNGSYRRSGANASGRSYTAPEAVVPPSAQGAQGTAGVNAIGTLTASAGDLMMRTVVSSEASTLPVELVSFEGTASGRQAHLSWITASETRNTGFAVELRTDGTDAWRQIDFVVGHGTTSEAHTYSVTTEALTPGRHAFRLRQIDTDGTATLSATVELTVGAERVLALHRMGANPFAGETTVGLTVPATGAVRVRLFDVLGRQVAVLLDGDVQAGALTRLAVSGAALASGVYVVQAEQGGRVETLTLTHTR